MTPHCLPQPLAPLSASRLSESDWSESLVEVESRRSCPFVSGLSHSVGCPGPPPPPRCSLCLQVEYCPRAWMGHILGVHSSTDGHVIPPSGCCECGCADTCLSPCLYFIRSGIAGPYGDSVFSFLRSHHTVSQRARLYRCTFPPATLQGSRLSPSSPKLVFRCCFDHNSWV